MNKTLATLLLMLIGAVVLVSADANVTVDVDSDGGEINAWLNANSGNGQTNYYIDGENYRQSLSEAGRSRASLVGKVYGSFMDYKLQPTGEWAWQDVLFEDLDRDYKKLRYVLETWFVPRKELVQVIQNQQMQISQLQLEVEAIGRVVNQNELCKARQQVMIELNIESITCGDITYYNEGGKVISLRLIN